MSSLSVAQANQVIADIREDNGGISIEDRSVLEEQLPRVLKALSSTRRKLSRATKTLVNNLYSTNTRFLYELIQNAEDNSYVSAISRQERPYIVFRLYPHWLIIDSNEDGFLEDNVRAICSVADSTKTNAQGYIGEKGIGFKAVFKVAKQVTIHSKPFHFAFHYTQDDDDDGLGMITPQTESPIEVPETVQTRLELALLDTVTCSSLKTDLLAIPEALLLFLHKLQTLSIELYDEDSIHPYYTVNFDRRHASSELNATYLSKRVTGDDGEMFVQAKYYVFKDTLSNLPKDEARKDKKGNYMTQAPVTIAFPVQEDNIPIIKLQHTFAFLPLRRVGFNFLLHSDFVTQANREDVTHSERNRAILHGAARLFRHAMTQFCNHSSLRWLWMRYLPPNNLSDEFWQEFSVSLMSELRSAQLLYARDNPGRFTPKELVVCPCAFRDNDREPLLPDLAAFRFLSDQYSTHDHDMLGKIGVNPLNYDGILKLLRHDINESDTISRWKSKPHQGQWRELMCSTLVAMFSEDERFSTALKLLPLVPTTEGKYRCKEDAKQSNSLARPGPIPVGIRSHNAIQREPDRPVFLSTTSGVAIPTDLDFDVVQPEVAANSSWGKLIALLGIPECPPAELVSFIHKTWHSGRLNFTVEQCFLHTKCLYYFHPHTSDILEFGIGLAVVNGDKITCYSAASNGPLYFPEEVDEFSPIALFSKNARSTGLNVQYLHKYYLDGVKPTVEVHGRTWKQWLRDFARVTSRIRLSHDNTLSPEFRYIAANLPDRLLGVLKQDWDTYEKVITPKIREELAQKEVLCSESSRLCPMNELFLPFPKLKKILERFKVESAVSFIPMHCQLRDEELQEWKFVDTFGVNTTDNLRFYSMVLLESKLERNDDLEGDKLDQDLLELYEKIQSKGKNSAQEVKSYFEDNDLVYIPASKDMDASWQPPSECVSSGPVWLKTKYRLESHYKQLSFLVEDLLDIPDLDQIDLINELLFVKNEELSFDVGIIYDYIYNIISSCNDADSRAIHLDALLKDFEESSLIFISQTNSWHSPSECVWAKEHIKIPNKTSIADHFRSKKTFFTRHLRVEEPTIKMHIESLKFEAKNRASSSNLKSIMMLISSLGMESKHAVELRNEAILPVSYPNGAIQFLSPADKDKMVIIDRIEHSNAFKTKLVSLDYSLEDIRDIRPFLAANDLLSQLSSSLVEEKRSVNNGQFDLVKTQDMQGKAREIVRCICHYSSDQDPKELHARISRMIVHASTSIKKFLRIKQGGTYFDGAELRSNFYVETVGGSLKAFVPKDAGKYELSMQLEFPRELAKHFGVSSMEIINTLGGVLRLSNRSALTEFLENTGVTEVSCDFGQSTDDLADNSDGDSGFGTLVDLTGDLTLNSVREDPFASNSRGRTNHLPITPIPPRHPAGAFPLTPNLTPTPLPFRNSSSPSPSIYQKVLEDIVRVARRRAAMGFFLTGASSNEQTQFDFTVDRTLIKSILDRGKPDREYKIGAAGELYVFEYLKGLKLPNFGLKNWKSTIRNRVHEHPEYSDIQAVKDWTAIADIEYEDVEGVFTQFLIRHGHLDGAIWSSSRPRYHLEVKATPTSNWQEPFFVSKRQELHIRNKMIATGQPSSDIYIICRVFNIGQGKDTGFNIYLDPGTQRRNGQLEFTAYSWQVKPLV